MKIFTKHEALKRPVKTSLGLKHIFIFMIYWKYEFQRGSVWKNNVNKYKNKSVRANEEFETSTGLKENEIFFISIIFLTFVSVHLVYKPTCLKIFVSQFINFLLLSVKILFELYISASLLNNILNFFFNIYTFIKDDRLFPEV